MNDLQLSQFLKEKNGQFSSIRLVFIIWLLGLLLSWGYVSFEKKELQKIDNSIILIVGILTTGKVSQKITEEKTSEEKKN